MPRWTGKPKAVQAAELRAAGHSISAISKKFGWTPASTFVNVSRGKKWKSFCAVNSAGDKRRRADIRRRERPAQIVAQLRKLGAEAASLGLRPEKYLSL